MDITTKLIKVAWKLLDTYITSSHHRHQDARYHDWGSKHNKVVLEPKRNGLRCCTTKQQPFQKVRLHSWSFHSCSSISQYDLTHIAVHCFTIDKSRRIDKWYIEPAMLPFHYEETAILQVERRGKPPVYFAWDADLQVWIKRFKSGLSDPMTKGCDYV